MIAKSPAELISSPVVLNLDLDNSLFSTSENRYSPALKRAIDCFNQWGKNAVSLLDSAIASDENPRMALIAKGLVVSGARHVRFKPVIEACFRRIAEIPPDDNPRDRVYLAALTKMYQGDYESAIKTFEYHLFANPTDLFSHRLVQQELFWSGQSLRMCALVHRAREHWTGDEDNFASWLAVLAFGYEEAGELDLADRFGRQAIEIDPGEAWAAHAVAHVFEMRGQQSQGATWLSPLAHNWGDVNHIAHHVAWHLSLFYLGLGDIDEVFNILRTRIRNPESALVKSMPDAYTDIQNVASLLMRLRLRGVDVSAFWADMADVAEGRIDNHQNPFTSVHAVMILAGAGRHVECQALLESMRAFAATDQGCLGKRMASAALPVAYAVTAHFNNDFESIVNELLPIQHRLLSMGGSHAQRDIVRQIVFDACRRTGRDEAARSLLLERQDIGFAEEADMAFWRVPPE